VRIAQVSPLHESVPPQLYGGTERVVSFLTEDLVGLGHDVTLFASGDSVTSARLAPMCDHALRLDDDAADPLAPHVRMLGRVYRAADDFDVIHCHTDYLGLPLAVNSRTPSLITLHGRLDVSEAQAVYHDHAKVPLVSISFAQRAPLPGVNWIANVYHGLPRQLLSPSYESGSYLLFLGRLSAEKCPDAAIRVAVRSGMPLRIAAKVDAADQQYFDEVMRPLLDHPLVEFLGEADEPRKEELLRGAGALLFPIDWPEPFGLVMIEALACGTPVIARSRGSVPEILTHDETGILCETEDEMVAAADAISRLSRIRCREEFDERFTSERMAREYSEIYRELARSPHLAAHPGRRVTSRRSS
jgi:glycosyltransferase involved in cell wall biosynthesis